LRIHRPLVSAPVFAILLLAAALPSGAGVNRWTSIGPDTGIVRSVAAAPSLPTTLYSFVGLDKVYSSTDRGNTWTLAGTIKEEAFQGISDIAVDPRSPRRVYALGFWQVFRSDDGGAGWRRVLPELGPETRPQSLVLHPRIPGLLYVLLTNGDLLRSANGGRRWTRSSTPSVAGLLEVDPSSPSVLYYASFLGKLYKSVNGGLTWFPSSRGLEQGLSFEALEADPSSPRTLYLIPASHLPDRKIFISRNSGATWTAIRSDLDGGRVRELTLETGRRPVFYLVLDDDRLLKSVDEGRTWSERAAPPLSIADLLPAPYGLLAGTPTGVYRSADQGASWSLSSRGIRALSVESLAIDPVLPFLYAQGHGVLFKSPDGGARWNLLSLSSGLLGPVATSPTRRGQVLVGAFSSVLRSTNGGRRWAEGEELGCAAPVSLAVNPVHESVIYMGIDFFEVPCGQNCRTFKSVDAGATWACIGNGIPGGGGSVVAADPRRPGILYVAPGQGEGIWRSEDDGASWSPLTLAFDPITIAVSPADPGFLYAGGTTGVAYSEDGGRSWGLNNEGMPTGWVYSLAVDPVDPRTIYAASSGNGVFKSTDGGTVWRSLGPGLEGLIVTALLIDPRDPKTLYVGTLEGGVLTLTQR
jgi:photosystem II stability/assembly factor-like uncharacterized protein